jgi:hypothetical protein
MGSLGGRGKWCEGKMAVQVTLLMQAFFVPLARLGCRSVRKRCGDKRLGIRHD